MVCDRRMKGRLHRTVVRRTGLILGGDMGGKEGNGKIRWISPNANAMMEVQRHKA